MPDLGSDDRERLLDIAESAVASGLSGKPSPAVRVTSPLAAPGASFVTLERDGLLLGCIGTLAAHRSLADDVRHNAHAAAFADPRLPAVTIDDYTAMDVEISVLGPHLPVPATGYDELVAQLRPGVDGLVVVTSGRRATLLPSVWRSVPDPDRFVAALWEKAGLRPRSWPVGIRSLRYEVSEVSRRGPRPAP